MLIGLTGFKGVGKDTAAQWLVEDYGYTRLGFADKLKEAVSNLFDLGSMKHVDDLKEYMAWVEVWHPLSSEAISFSWREFLQRFGTEMGRETFGQDFWIDQWSDAYDLLETDGYPKVVATDVRFVNEALRINAYGGRIIRITRPGHEPDGHASEVPLPNDIVDATVDNDSSIGDFHQKFIATVEALKVGITSA